VQAPRALDAFLLSLSTVLPPVAVAGSARDDADAPMALSSAGQLWNKTHTQVMKMNCGDVAVVSAMDK
jgi:hypothetical protein